MIIYDVFCEINEPICVSKKLGLYLINPCKRDPFYSEVKTILRKNLSQEKKHSRKWRKKEYNLREILLSQYWNKEFNVDNNSTENDCINEITRKIVILIQINMPGTIYDETDIKRLHCEQIDEYSIEHKISMLQSWLPSIIGKRFSGVLYDDQANGLFTINEHYHILSGLERKIHKNEFIPEYSFKNNKEDIENNICEIKAFGEILDNYIEKKEDFYKLDFIMDHLIEQTSHYQFFLSPLYIIEMLIVNPNCSIREQFKQKIKYFYNGNNHYISENIEKFANNVYEIRSKLVHGYFNSFEKELRKYKKNFMKDFWFDYYEFTENHWILGAAGGELEQIAKNIVVALLQSKEELIKFKNDDKTSVYFQEKKI